MKKAVFWVVAPCKCGVNRRFGGTYKKILWRRDRQNRLLATVLSVSSPADFLIFSFYPEDGGDMFLRNIG
jgi:hypothetical protein